MAVTTMKACFNSDVRKVWDVVTSLENYAWRSDLGRIDIVNEKQFIEYTKEGYATTFTITATDICKCWEFDMENNNMIGHWIGKFFTENDQTFIEFTENVEVKKWVMKPFVKGYLEKQQKQYMDDLRRALGE